MRFSVFTASTPEWTPDEAAGALAAQGWDGIEWRVTDQDAAAVPGFWAGNRATWPLTGLESHVDEIAAVTARHGLAYSGLGGYARCDEHDDVDRMLAVTAALGAERVRVTMPRVDSGRYDELFYAARRDLEWVASRAEQHGVKALVELHHETITASASAARRLVDGLDPRYVGVIHDLGNLVIEGQETHSAAFELLGPYLAHVHVKNARWVAADPATDGVVAWRHEWASLRAGQADVRQYVSDLVAHGYDGWITLEDFSTDLPLVERTSDNLAFMRDALERARS
ncbi:MAG TPA: sugar phosphate isomerase/epimerase family protein [Galbitalea sp.]|jgi:sugar phosphate isomerase/epimerase